MLLLLSALLSSQVESKKVAIIGGGFGGTSAAYFIINQTAVGAHEVHLFEKSDRIGGRVENTLIYGMPYELGADVCHRANLFCDGFRRQFNLTDDSNTEGTKEPRSNPIITND